MEKDTSAVSNFWSFVDNTTKMFAEVIVVGKTWLVSCRIQARGIFMTKSGSR